ncbi:MAG: hypothetical protein SVP26_05990, partial [Chloroflexota bacterium]|nr:hypothetical protein [Chloroflexota bacterium]
RNTQGYDVVVLDPIDNEAIGIQVKCTDKKEFPVLSAHWNDCEQKIDEKILSAFIFVNISDVDNPRYFIVPRHEMRNLLKSETKRYMQRYQDKHKLTWEEMLQKEREEKRKPNLWVVKLDDVRGYEDRWDNIVKEVKESE